MKKEQLKILQHSLGVDQYGLGEQFRNHFATSPGSKDFKKCCDLCISGHMRDLGKRELWGKSHCFVVTRHGKEAVSTESPDPPKLSRGQKRYQDYLNNADCFESFFDFIKYNTRKTGK